MPTQLRHPEKAAPLSPGVLRSKQPSNLRSGQIRRGNYCHRYFICANQNQLDEDQTVCLICDRFIPLFSNVDPLAQAKVMGYEVGFKLIKQALVFESKRTYSARSPKKTKLNGRKPKATGPGEKRCSNPDCKNPILPATPEYFHRNRTNPDGLENYCKPCKTERAKLAYKNKLKNTAWVEAGPPIGGEVRP